ncbi:MAG: DUF4249 domain-containing protein [Ekhidna sp.]|uniref:DUF4249 domain-containing protein n=1 Tax=Ekhidna sp. TaxID=2608089 RepID=UPI0032EDC15B
MKKLAYISLLFLIFSCEEVVVVDLPDPQNLVVVEGWLSDIPSNQAIRLTRSTAFSNQGSVTPIEDAEVIVQSRSGDVFRYSYTSDGYYHSDSVFGGTSGEEYRLRIVLDTLEIRSDWDQMSTRVPIENLRVESFQENDPNNSDQQITIYYPKINTRDPQGIRNYYRWIFLRNGDMITEPEPITVQDDRLFDGNLIPNNFQNFEYDSGDEMTVQLQAISSDAYDYLDLLRSQITTLGTSSGTTPAIVEGNLFYLNDERPVLGFFGTVAVSSASISIP